ncbi:MAG: hypothetical protein ACLTSG_00615 [Lachnospiraceae bacterium]
MAQMSIGFISQRHAINTPDIIGTGCLEICIFLKKNISSLTNVDDGATPATAVLVCEAAYYIDTISNGDSGIEAMEDTDMLNSSYKTEIMFYDDKLLMDGILFTRTDDMDPVLAELVRLFIDVNL